MQNTLNILSYLIFIINQWNRDYFASVRNDEIEFKEIKWFSYSCIVNSAKT